MTSGLLRLCAASHQGLFSVVLICTLMGTCSAAHADGLSTSAGVGASYFGGDGTYGVFGGSCTDANSLTSGSVSSACSATVDPNNGPITWAGSASAVATYGSLHAAGQATVTDATSAGTLSIEDSAKGTASFTDAITTQASGAAFLEFTGNLYGTIYGGVNAGSTGLFLNANGHQQCDVSPGLAGNGLVSGSCSIFVPYSSTEGPVYFTSELLAEAAASSGASYAVGPFSINNTVDYSNTGNITIQVLDANQQPIAVAYAVGDSGTVYPTSIPSTPEPATFYMLGLWDS